MIAEARTDRLTFSSVGTTHSPKELTVSSAIPTTFTLSTFPLWRKDTETTLHDDIVWAGRKEHDAAGKRKCFTNLLGW